MRNSLRTQLILSLVLLVVAPLLIIGAGMIRRILVEERQQAIFLQDEIAKRVTTEVEAYIFAREDELSMILDLQGLPDLPVDQQRALLRSLANREDLYSEIILMDRGGEVVIFESPVLVSAEREQESYLESAIFNIPRGEGNTYYSSVQIDDVSGEPFMTIAIPFFDITTGAFDGVLAASFRFRPMWNLMEEISGEIDGLVYVVDSNNRVVAHPNRSVVLQGTTFTVPPADGFAVGLAGDDVALALESINFGLSSTLRPQSFDIVAELPESEALALAISTIYNTILNVIIAAVVTVILGAYLALRITRPIGELAAVAEAISAGDLSQKVSIVRSDEIGTLGVAFNGMTERLRSLIGSLEQRVAERTKALASSVEVSRSLSTILDSSQLVKEVVTQIQSAFGYYHAHIYLLDETGQNLVMAGGTGEAGQKMLDNNHQIERGKGLVGRAAATQASVLVSDVSKDESWLPNPLLPDTKSEVAVPIIYGDDVVGVLDVQHYVIDGLQPSDVDLLESIAAQVAIALQNARAYERARSRAEREARFNEINRTIQTTTDPESALQVAVRELGRVLKAKEVRVQLHTGQNGRSPEGQSS